MVNVSQYTTIRNFHPVFHSCHSDCHSEPCARGPQPARGPVAVVFHQRGSCIRPGADRISQPCSVSAAAYGRNLVFIFPFLSVFANAGENTTVRRELLCSLRRRVLNPGILAER